jgi:hypothetical protein
MASDPNDLGIRHQNESVASASGPSQSCQNAPKITSLDEATQAFEKMQSQWLLTPCRERLFEVIKHLHSNSPLKITKAVSLAIGPITNPGPDWEVECRCRHSLIQLVVFLDIAKHGAWESF